MTSQEVVEGIVTGKKRPNPTILTGEEMANQFARNLLGKKDALDYLESRGVKRDLAEKGLVGFCPPYSHHWFPLMKGRITVPIRNVHGTVIAFAGRRYDAMAEMTEKAMWEWYEYDPAEAQRKVQQWHRGKWINEPFPKGLHLYGLDRAKPFIRSMGYVNLVEGYFDTDVLSIRHMPNTVSLCGTSLTEVHIALLARFTNQVNLILDPDEAGIKAQATAAPKLHEAGFKQTATFLPDDYDPDQFAVKFGGRQLRLAIEGMMEREEQELRIRV